MIKFRTVDEMREWFEMLGRMDGRLEGRLQGAADAVVRVLKIRGFEVTERMERWLWNQCTDETSLDELLTRAVTFERLEDVFADEVGSKSG